MVDFYYFFYIEAVLDPSPIKTDFRSISVSDMKKNVPFRESWKCETVNACVYLNFWGSGERVQEGSICIIYIYNNIYYREREREIVG